MFLLRLSIPHMKSSMEQSSHPIFCWHVLMPLGMLNMIFFIDLIKSRAPNMLPTKQIDISGMDISYAPIEDCDIQFIKLNTKKDIVAATTFPKATDDSCKIYEKAAKGDSILLIYFFALGVSSISGIVGLNVMSLLSLFL